EDGIRDKLVTGVQTCALPICKRRQPGLVSVLRAEVAQDRIGKVTLHQFRHPRLPVVEILTECLHVLPLDMSPQQFACCWRGTGRSEERRVGKEWRTRSAAGGW